MKSSKNRLLLLLVAGAMMRAGAGLCAQQAATVPSVKAYGTAPSLEGGLRQLQALVEAAEGAVQAAEWEAVSDRVDEAEALTATWSAEKLRKPEEAALLERLRVVENRLDEETASEGQDGLKVAEETVALTGEDLRTQLAQVKAAEQDVVFDFPIDLNDKVLAWVYEFTHAKRGFVEGALSRATQYLPMVKQIFQEEGIPQDLVYLALIESGFRNTANSPAKAVGMWQFIRSTGRLFGLTGNAWIEERRDPVKSCRASARYLRHLFEASGDWYLALAGYNAGPLTLERAGNALGTRNFWDMARSRYLRDETKHYVPKLMAAILVGRFPERYGLNIVQMTPYAYELVEVDKMTSLSVLAKYADTDVEAIKELNPELLRATTPPGHYTLRVPPGASGATYRALASIPTAQRLDFQAYVIRRGDTLAKVAARFKVSPDDLLEANNLAKTQFRAGKRIQVPPPSMVPIDDRDLKPMAAKDRSLIERPLASLPVIPPEPAESALPEGAGQPPKTVSVELRAPKAHKVPEKAPEAAANAKPATHTVKRGETLYSIGERYGISAKDLAKWNKIKRNRITAGQKLKLRVP
ncbi:MAG TPA: LysM peptidoglycan-binding domain-containing protein [Holophaga sp.]|nr:LysM peptidoglycan-binding domain-containing protein [Holophaga sp.]HPS67598.1 LysM peptidoglycan-binding domain-containing protein [Holophaga sp.]